MEAMITDIKKFSTHDGEGIRTTVFFKGCPLNCIWCHNPESIGFNPILGYYENKCINCGECLKVCKNDAHKFYDNRHIFLRQNCLGCGECEKICLGNALILYGKKYNINELLSILLEDKDFYKESRGGVTLSGGECLCQSEFCTKLLKMLKKCGINTAVDTCGFTPKKNIDRVIPYTDTFLYDIKAIDEDIHIKCTGQSNKLILENVKYIDSQNKAIEIRIPYVPNYNDTQIDKIAEFTGTLKNVKKIKILPYHNYAVSKYTALDIKDNLPKILPSDREIQIAEDIINKKINFTTAKAAKKLFQRNT